MMEDEKTEKTGSEPGAKNEDVNPDDKKVDTSATDKDVKDAKPSDAEVPWHKDPRFKQDLGLLKAAKAIMDSNNLEDIDDLKELIESGRKVHGKKIDLDQLDEIAKKAETLDRYQKHWEQQEELKKQGTETPEQTIARLKKERDDVIGKSAQKEATEREHRDAQKAVVFYEGEVKTQLDSIAEDRTPIEREFLAWSLGVGNSCNEITITDKKAIKSVINDGLKKYNKLVEAIKAEGIQEYLNKKQSIPSVPSTDGSAPAINKEPPKGLKNLRKVFHEMAKGGNGG
jgi:hypothetical protein